jgi:transcription elongation factor Elf1
LKDLTLDDFFGDQSIDFNCPSCDHLFEIPFSIATQERSIVICPSCNVNIELNHDETTKETLEDVDKSLEEFNKATDRLSKAMKKF